MSNNERDFKGVWIPKEVWLDTRLNALEKVILTEIDSLDSSERGCWASNKHIADFCQCSETKVSTAISKLIEYEYLYVQSFDGRIRELKSRLSNFERQNLKNCEPDFKNLKQSNTYNNTSINTDIIKKEIILFFIRYHSSFSVSASSRRSIIQTIWALPQREPRSWAQFEWHPPLHELPLLALHFGIHGTKCCETWGCEQIKH